MDKRYLAGLFDGDGGIRIAKTRSHPNLKGNRELYLKVSIAIGSTNKQITEILKQNLGGFIIIKKTPKNKPFYQWEMTGLKKIKNFLENIAPYSIIKKKEIELTLKLINSRISVLGKRIYYSPREMELANQIRQFHKHNIGTDIWST